MPFIVMEKNETGEVWGLGENHEFGLIHVEFKLTLRHAKRKKNKQLQSSELGGTIQTEGASLLGQLYKGFIKTVDIEKVIRSWYRE